MVRHRSREGLRERRSTGLAGVVLHACHDTRGVHHHPAVVFQGQRSDVLLVAPV